MYAALRRQKGRIIMKKYCTKCGKSFEAVGREVICPACKQAAAEETKRAAVERAKRASWTGESVPVRISGRASTIIRQYGAAYNLPFAQALDALLQASDYFEGMGIKWETIEPYKSHRRDKHTTETQDAQTTQDVKQVAHDTASKPQTAQEVKPQEVKTVKQAAKAASKTSKAASKQASKPASKATSTSKK